MRAHDGGETSIARLKRHVDLRGQAPSAARWTKRTPPLRPILVAQLNDKTKLVRDDAGQYRHMHRDFDHSVVNHGIGEYVRGDAHTNAVEGYFSILKRDVTDTYHHVSQQHLKRYLAEFDFRYNELEALGVSDSERARKALEGIWGKRLTYRRTGDGANV